MLHAQNIHKSYGQLEVLKGIDLNVSEKEVISIVGSSGAGKSTLLQILGTLDQADEGIVEINNTNISKLSTKKRSRFRNQNIGFIFQFHNLLPEFTAVENIAIPAIIGGMDMQESRKRAIELLTLMGLKNRDDHKPSELSGGEQQRVSVARALINNPKIVFADEPSGNLDSRNATELHKLFFKLRDEFGQSFVIVTHNNELAEMSDRKLVMTDGKMT
ncbi:MAG: lipoprotein-releasing system ATP-binding protein [Cyclobacteriaceae bacterium]|jgi:lipoprotein-releasing system ATP-binding protein